VRNRIEQPAAAEVGQVVGSPAAYAPAMCIQPSVAVISFYQLVAAASA
jgi:hypothetical protein